MNDDTSRETMPASHRMWSRAAWFAAFAVPGLVLAGLTVHAWFLCDDAFISFRYARNLINGHGLVFNPGERVEGYSNLLWVLEMAGLWRLGLRPEIAAPALSIALTIGTLAIVVAGARRSVPERKQTLAAWIAFTFLACCPGFAEWSTGGLETRQFTFLIVLGAFAVARSADSVKWTLVGSLSFAAAELTRPEGLLLFGCAAFWCVVNLRLGGKRDTRRYLALLLPFAVVVCAHFLLRYAYYGEWLPNTYYAKHVRAWYESGGRYLAAAAIELGAWVWLPLAAVALVRRNIAACWKAVLPFALILPHALYVAHIGGDHFAFRPLDYYLPLMAPLAAAGLLRVAGGPFRATARPAWSTAIGALVALLAVCCSHAVGTASFLVARQVHGREQTKDLDHQLTTTSAPWLFALPGSRFLADRLNELRSQMVRNAVALSVHEHAELGRDLISKYAAYEVLPAGMFPESAVTALGSVGILPFYLHGLRVIDTLGLTDAVVARNPSLANNENRKMAHDREAPPGYLRQRGANIYVHASVSSAVEALAIGMFAIDVSDSVWMPFLTTDLLFPPESFPAERLVARHNVSQSRADLNEIRLSGKKYVGVRLLCTFEAATPSDLNWTCSESAHISSTPALMYGAIGERALATPWGRQSAAASGRAFSDEFTPEPDTHLVMFLAGQTAPGLRVDLCHGDTVLRSFERFGDLMAPVACPVGAFAGLPLHLEVHDAGPGKLALDHVMLAKAVEDSMAALSASWSPTLDANLQVLRGVLDVPPLPSKNGQATSATTRFTFRNPRPAPVRITFELVAGTSNARISFGEWILTDTDQPVMVVPPGKEARMRVEFDALQPVLVAGDSFVLRATILEHATSTESPAPWTIEFTLPWRDAP